MVKSSFHSTLENFIIDYNPVLTVSGKDSGMIKIKLQKKKTYLYLNRENGMVLRENPKKKVYKAEDKDSETILPAKNDDFHNEIEIQS